LAANLCRVFALILFFLLAILPACFSYRRLSPMHIPKHL